MLGDPKTTAFGILPLGTGNDIAAALNVPKDIDDAIETLVANNRQNYDIGVAMNEDKSNIRYFAGADAPY